MPHDGIQNDMARFPKVWAHRGARAEAPENTLPAFLRACELGADGIELDVMACATGELVVTHDFEVSRLSDGTGRVADLTLSDIKRLDFSNVFAGKFSGVSAPTLDEVVRAVPARILLNIEVKNERVKGGGEEIPLVRLIHEFDLVGRTIVSSFNPFVLRRIRTLDPRIRIGWLYENHPPFYLHPKPVQALLRPDAVHPEFTAVTEETVELAHRRGFAVNVWTVNEDADMRRLIAWGVDGIITDRPDRLLALKAEASNAGN